MKSTSLNDLHRKLGARMVPYAGWDMPVQYGGGPAAEAKACRATAGLFDVSHMGEVRVVGSEALDFVQYVTTNDASKLPPGKAQYSLLLNPEGGVKDDIIVYRVGDDEFLIVLNAGCKDKDWEWLAAQARSYPGATLTDESDQTALIAVQGPEAVALVDGLSADHLSAVKRFRHKPAQVANVDVLASRTGYTGEDGFELFCAWGDAEALWSALQAAGGVPCGLASRDVLRIEAAYPLYGHEIDEETSPIGSGLGWAIKTHKKDFIGRNPILEKMQGITKQKLIGLKVPAEAKAIPRDGCAVYAPKVTDSIGVVTSGTLSPMLGSGIAMARIGAGWIESGTELIVDIRGRLAPVEVVELPFYRNGV